MFFVDRIGLRGQDRVPVADAAIEARNVDTGEVVCFCKLPAKLGRISLAKCQRHEEIELVGIAEPHFVCEPRTDGPYVSNLSIILAHVVALTVDRTNTRAETLAGIVSLTFRYRDPVVGPYVIVKPSEKSDERIRRRRGIGVVVGEKTSTRQTAWRVWSRPGLLNRSSDGI